MVLSEVALGNMYPLQHAQYVCAAHREKKRIVYDIYAHSSLFSPSLLSSLSLTRYMDKPPNGYHSTKGIGRMQPDPEGTYITAGGVVIPTGRPVKSSDNPLTSLHYNEYIVYNVEQINIKYLLRLRFNYH